MIFLSSPFSTFLLCTRAFKVDSKMRSRVQEETKSPDFPSTWLSVKESHLILWLESTAAQFSNVARDRLYIPGNITLRLGINRLLQHYYVLKIYRITHLVWMTKSKLDRICIKHINISYLTVTIHSTVWKRVFEIKASIFGPWYHHDDDSLFKICGLFLASVKKKNLGKWMSWEVTINNNEVREG